jgi:hypothetical protein
MNLERIFGYVSTHIFEPSLNWCIAHPIISVVVIGLLIFFAARNYKML